MPQQHGQKKKNKTITSHSLLSAKERFKPIRTEKKKNKKWLKEKKRETLFPLKKKTKTTNQKKKKSHQKYIKNI